MKWAQRLVIAGVESSLCALLATAAGAETAPSGNTSNIQNNNNQQDTPVWVVPKAVQEWRQKFNSSCLAPEEKPSTDIEKQIASIARLVSKSPIGRSLYDFAARNDFVFCSLDVFENVANTTTGMNIDRMRATGHTIRDDFISTDQLTTAVHEWRHSWQGIDTAFSNRNGINHPPPDAVAKSWMREADASAISILFAWDMSKKGYPEMWQSALNNATYGNMARAFEKELLPALHPNPKPGDFARATRAAFYAWLDDEFLTDSYYGQATAKFPDKGQPFTPTRDDIQKLGQIPGIGGLSYLDENDWKKVQSKAFAMYNVRQNPSPGPILPPVKTPPPTGPKM